MSAGIAVPARGSDDLNRILNAPRVLLGQWPTPVDAIEWQGSPILVKRDDLSGFGRGGAKTRKIEHLLGSMRARGCDELITVVGNITNLGFDLLPALRAHDFGWRIFVHDDPPLSPLLRAALFDGIQGDLRFLGKNRIASTTLVLMEWLRRRAAGKRPFLLLPGASHPAGVVGNACGFAEMVGQLREAGRPLPTTVFVSVATGTTIAGFLLAEQALRSAGADPIRIVGVQTYPGDVVARTRLLLRWTERHLGLGDPVDPARIDIRSEALDGGFGHARPQFDELCRRVRTETGLQLDPIFGGKTWSVMEQTMRSESSPQRPVMFWHCGHTPGWETLVNAVRGTRNVENAAASPEGVRTTDFLAPSKLAIIALYVAAFYGALPAFLWLLGGRLDHALALPRLESGTALAIGVACLGAGAWIVLSSTGSLFRIGNGLPISHLPPSRLVHDGMYRWMRHPHYVGFNLAFAGSGLIVGSPGRAFGAGLILLGLWLLYAMVFEEPRLERRFGDDYGSYRKLTGMIPGLPAGAAFQQLFVRLNAPLTSLANRLVLFRTGPILWVTYGLLAALAAVPMGGGIAWFLVDQGLPGIDAWWSVLIMSAMVPVFSRVAWFAIPGDKPRQPYFMLMRRVGFVSWGGYAAALAGGLWVGAAQGISPLRMLDLVMMTGLIASAVSRWGCFTYGCCIGKRAGWGIRWLEPDSWIHRLRPGPSDPRIPTQILSSLHAAVAGVILFALSLRASSPGALAAIGAILYALPRFGVEHLREEARFGRWQLTAGQVGCAIVFVLGVALLLSGPDAPAAFWAGGDVLGAWPWVLACSATAFVLTFIAYGLHWKKVGRW